MKSISKLLHFNIESVPDSERYRFYAFTYSKLLPVWTLLTFGMPALFVVGWLRDYSLFGADSRALLLIRLMLVAALLITAVAMRLSGLSRRTEALGILYALLFSITIIVLTAIEQAKLSLTHVAVMLMTIILLPYALRPPMVVGVVLAMCVPMFGLLAYLQVPPGMWLAYLLFAVTGVVIGIAQRNANLHASLEIFMHRQRLLKHLQQDTLTGMSNRDGWEAKALRLHRQQCLTEKPLSILYMDLDHFKSINDHHGHAVGDAVLSMVGEAMRRQIRNEDLLARLGGEEFVALLPNIEADGAAVIAERMRNAIESLECAVPVTVSIGLAQAWPLESLASVTHRADEALLQAKNTGRNRVVSAPVNGLDP